MSFRQAPPGWSIPPQHEAEGRAAILYVDIDERSAKFSAAQLRASYTLQHAQNDREACDLLRRYADDFVAVMLDVDLQGSVLDGILLTRILRGRVPEKAIPPYARQLPTLSLPVILVSDRAGSYSTDEVRRFGGDTVLQKPLDIGRVSLAIVEHALVSAHSS